MSELETLKKEFIEFIYEKAKCYLKIDYFPKSFNLESYELYSSCMNKKTFDEIIIFTTEFHSFWHLYGNVDSFNQSIKKKIEEVNRIRISIIEKELSNIKDNSQNTTDIVNLFTDIDKNRTNLEDKVDKLEQKINKLESSIEQILNLLQKS